MKNILEKSWVCSGVQTWDLFDEGERTHGFVVTPVGVVGVSSYKSEGHPLSIYDFACHGRNYRRWEPRARTRRGLAIEAHRFAKRCELEARKEADE